ncbi:MAG: membrane-associated heme-binding lipoprotein HmuY [Algoriphagus marincola HL-49]|uniref:Membrane-associated heme-binding lipoprotein HmuY n=1 Tax=Algoriphagus marincola HL-49 TaxID=1305737 RepID=A0A0P8AMI1_9BACT|nr:MAG: membrane-associated heme-binding lipoprotein HmuY [Algoriphagus marincola HL-49]
MKTIQKLLFTAAISGFLFSCDSNDDPLPIVPLEAILVEDLAAPNDVIDRNTGEVTEERPFQFFSLEQNALVSENEDWDLAFKGTTIRVNSSKNVSAAVVNGIFEEITEVPANATFATDTESSFAIPTGSGNGWYNYNSATFTVTPIPGRVILVQTTEGNYSKIEILSYYKGNPPVDQIDPRSTPSGHYTFRYVLRPDGTSDF